MIIAVFTRDELSEINLQRMSVTRSIYFEYFTKAEFKPQVSPCSVKGQPCFTFTQRVTSKLDRNTVYIVHTYSSV
jgi:hypothetical protein